MSRSTKVINLFRKRKIYTEVREDHVKEEFPKDPEGLSSCPKSWMSVGTTTG